MGGSAESRGLGDEARGLVGGQTGDYNRDRFGLDDIVLWGQSIGSGPVHESRHGKRGWRVDFRVRFGERHESFNRRSEGKTRDTKPGEMFSKV